MGLLIAGLINDAFALAKVGLLPYGAALDLTLYLGNGSGFCLNNLKYTLDSRYFYAQMEYMVFISGPSFLLYFTVIAIKFELFLGSNERSVAPWETAFLALDYLADVLYFDKLYPKLNQYLSQLVKPLFGDLGWTGTANDSMDTLKLRTIILKKNCIYGTASSHAGKLLLDWKVILLKNYMKWKKYQ